MRKAGYKTELPVALRVAEALTAMEDTGDFFDGPQVSSQLLYPRFGSLVNSEPAKGCRQVEFFAGSQLECATQAKLSGAEATTDHATGRRINAATSKACHFRHTGRAFNLP